MIKNTKTDLQSTKYSMIKFNKKKSILNDRIKKKKQRAKKTLKS
jgi:hypothetical protein